MFKITLAVPCFERPERTIRAIECVLNQDMNDWEAYFAGDKCPFIQKLVDSGEAMEYINRAKEKGNKLAIFNLPNHYGYWGYQQRTTITRLADSEYFMFMDNDDVIKPNHFRHYYDEISKTNNDFMYFNTWIDPIEHRNAPKGSLREARMEKGMIGHQELIIKTSFLKTMPPMMPIYEADWALIQSMVAHGAKYEKGAGDPTHIIMSVGELRETEID